MSGSSARISCATVAMPPKDRWVLKETTRTSTDSCSLRQAIASMPGGGVGISSVASGGRAGLPGFRGALVAPLGRRQRRLDGHRRRGRRGRRRPRAGRRRVGGRPRRGWRSRRGRAPAARRAPAAPVSSRSEVCTATPASFDSTGRFSRTARARRTLEGWPFPRLSRCFSRVRLHLRARSGVGLPAAGVPAPVGAEADPVRRRRAQLDGEGVGLRGRVERGDRPLGPDVPRRLRGRPAQPGRPDPLRGAQRARLDRRRAHVRRVARHGGA